MASTFSTSLKIQLIGNGEQSGVWGTTTNNNWNLIEQAVAGVRSITMANANYTLSNLNGVDDEARNMVLVVAGTNSAIRQIIAPLVQKMYVVTNNTVGGYAITIGGATGSLISVPNGTTVQVYCDGTNFYSAQTSSAGNFLVNGNLTVAGTTTLTGNATANVFTATTITGTTINGTSFVGGSFSGTTVNGTTITGTSFVGGPFSGTTINGTTITGTAFSGGTFSGTTIGGTTITASTQFSGPGTGLTGTAAGLSIGGSSGTANATAYSVTFTNTGGAVAGTTFNGSAARTIDYSTVGAPKADGTGATGTWGINISGNAGTVTNGVYTTGSYADPSWITALAASKLTGQTSVPHGGTGVATLSGIAYGNGTSAFTAATASQVVAAIGSTAVTNATNATTATNLAGGAANRIPYQTGSGATSFLVAPSVTNTTILWDGSSITWGASGAPVASGCIYLNNQTISANYEMLGTYNGQSAGPITIADGVTVTLDDGANWIIN